MPKYRAGAYDKGTKQKGQYVVVEANTAADAMIEVRKYFPGTPIQRIFARESEPWDKITSVKQPFSAKPKREAQ
jgi:hypothetical protein